MTDSAILILHSEQEYDIRHDTSAGCDQTSITHGEIHIVDGVRSFRVTVVVSPMRRPTHDDVIKLVQKHPITHGPQRKGRGGKIKRW